MLNPGVTSALPKPDEIIKETVVRLLKESDNIGYSLKISTEVGGELLQQMQTYMAANPNENELKAVLFVFSKTINTLMTVHRLDMAIHTKLLATLLTQLSEGGYAEAYKELKKLRIQDIANEREWILKKFQKKDNG